MLSHPNAEIHCEISRSAVTNPDVHALKVDHYLNFKHVNAALFLHRIFSDYFSCYPDFIPGPTEWLINEKIFVCVGKFLALT